MKKEFMDIEMEIYMKENLKMIKEMTMESINAKMETYLKVNIKIIKVWFWNFYVEWWRYFEGGYKEGLRNGHWIFKYNNGDAFEGEFKNDEPNVFGIVNFIVEGEYKDVKMNGHGAYKWKEFEVEYKKGLGNGFGIIWYNNGDIFEVQFKND